MPIIDVQIVVGEGTSVPAGTAQVLADRLAAVLAAPPGRLWVRVTRIPADSYAENGQPVAALPVFLRVLHADLPPSEALSAQSRSIADAVATCLDRPRDCVHVEYAPAGRGRVAFGGELVR
jgi:phenylpyruvate tautomerase PptA (4-oxalocrotonate tautomerase family)